MENKKNYQLEMEKVIAQAKREGDVPTLFLHSCCAPCSSHVLEYLSEYFKITVFYYNPNIYPRDEYEERLGEIRRLVREMPSGYPVEFVAVSYTHLDVYKRQLLNFANGYDRFHNNRGKKKKRFAGAALMTAGVGLFLLCVVSALTIWWG